LRNEIDSFRVRRAIAADVAIDPADWNRSNHSERRNLPLAVGFWIARLNKIGSLCLMPATPSELVLFMRQSALLVWRTEANGYVMNLPEWSALTGQTEEEFRGDGWLNALHPDDIERTRMAWHVSVIHGLPYNTDYRVRHADGGYRWVNSRGIPVMNAEGNVDHWVGALFAVAGALRSPKPTAELPSGQDEFTDITPAALRAARGALGWSAARLAEEANISLSTVRRLETESRMGENFRPVSVEKVLVALIRAKLTFIGEGEIVTGIEFKH